MTALTTDQTTFYQQNGYLAPIEIFTEDEARSLYETFQQLERDYGKVLQGYGRNNSHQVLPPFDQIAHHPRILDVIESLIGPNILVAGTTLFIKKPEQRGFISCHQDAVEAMQLDNRVVGFNRRYNRKWLYVYVARKPPLGST